MVMWTGWDFPPSYIGAYHNVMPGTILRVCYFSVTKKMPGFGFLFEHSLGLLSWPIFNFSNLMQFEVALFLFLFCWLFVRSPGRVKISCHFWIAQARRSWCHVHFWIAQARRSWCHVHFWIAQAGHDCHAFSDSRRQEKWRVYKFRLWRQNN